MKNTLIFSKLKAATLTIALGLGFLPVAAHADMQTIRNADNAIWVSAGTGYYNYKEHITAPNLPDSERHWMPSIAAGMSSLTNTDFYYALEGSVVRGRAAYNGAYFNAPTTPLQSTTFETITEVDAKLGRAYAVGQNALMIPYVDFGGRYWNRNLGGGQVEVYRHLETLGGVMLQSSIGNQWVLSGYGAMGGTYLARMTTGGYAYKLHSALTEKAGAKIGYNLTRTTELFTTADYNHFSYGKSGVVNSAYEPTSHTGETALRVGISFHIQ